MVINIIELHYMGKIQHYVKLFYQTIYVSYLTAVGTTFNVSGYDMVLDRDSDLSPSQQQADDCSLVK